ncbi:hypothetical protein ACX1C1_10575 [Paenibacillus sp. strain BS8-2]
MQKLMPPLVRIEDGKIEQIIRGASSIARDGARTRYGWGRERQEDNWTQLALHSACLAVGDLCLIPASERTYADVETSCMRRFTNRHYRFNSPEHFLQTRQQMITNLQKFFVDEPCNGTLMTRFETFMVYVEELDMELSQRFHLIIMPEANKGDYIVQKLVVDDNLEAMELYFHMTVVFGMTAFGHLPSRIEAIMPLSGKRLSWKPDGAKWQQSMDYMRLVKSMLGSSNVGPAAAIAVPIS